uniref:adenine-specific methyltransferase EcoRI family protein n=1 Tax=Thioalkalivibrio sp. HK1 TaxID=1469245 RepID=UPI0004705101
EFYTLLTDIEKELRHYERHFKGKVVYCNCDDPRISAFFHYFSYRFESLGLKRLITACYKSQSLDLFSRHDSQQAVYLEYKGDSNENKTPDVSEIGIRSFKGNGDFRNTESINLLNQADIVVTNPPFSLFREYIAQLIEYKKQFLIIGNVNAVSYKEIFPLIKENKLWFGPSIRSGDREFEIPDHYPLNAAGVRIDENGKKYIRIKGVRWYTNLDHAGRHEEMILYNRYTPDEYPTYDNYNAIEVSKTKNIPMDYNGVMGVPITFLDKYNPEQFEIIGSDYDVKENLLPELVNPKWKGKLDRAYLNGKRIYARLLIKKRSHNS